MLFHLPKLPAEIRVSHLNARVNEQRKIAQTTASRLELLQLAQQLAKEAKIRRKNNQKIFVLDFKGDIQASAVENLREEITLILATAKAGRDRVVVRLESPGGMVHGYGLAAAQLVRLRDAGFHLTICVDKVAASGGYMMACIANEIISAPFAVVGSIGVVAQVPNFNRLLKNITWTSNFTQQGNINVLSPCLVRILLKVRRSLKKSYNKRMCCLSTL